MWGCYALRAYPLDANRHQLARRDICLRVGPSGPRVVLTAWDVEAPIGYWQRYTRTVLQVRVRDSELHLN